jgi:hypothetical protein
MHSAFCKFGIAVVGIAVVTSVAGCGGNDAADPPSASSVAAPSPSSPPVDVEAAFAQVKEAVKPFWCSNAYSDMGDMAHAGNIDAMRLRVHEYRGVMTTWDDDLGRIAVPPAAQPIIDKIGELNAAEMADLDALAGVDDKDKEQINRLLGRVYYDDALVAVEADHLSAALGHPEPQGQIAADQLELANQTYYTEQFPSSEMFEVALSRNDLNGAKAANAVQEDAAQRYIDRLDAIDWPAGFEDQVDALRDGLRKVIEFDRHQVDVATTAQIVRGSEDAPESQAVEDARSSLQNGLLKLASESAPPLRC